MTIQQAITILRRHFNDAVFVQVEVTDYPFREKGKSVEINYSVCVHGFPDEQFGCIYFRSTNLEYAVNQALARAKPIVFPSPSIECVDAQVLEAAEKLGV